MMNAAAASSSSTAHGRARSPRRASTSRSSFCSSSRICSSAKRPEHDRRGRSGSGTPGRNDAAHRVLDAGRPRSRSAARSKPTGVPVAIDEPMFEVSRKTQRRKSTRRAVRVGQPAVVEDLQEEVPDLRVAPSRTRRAARPRTGPCARIARSARRPCGRRSCRRAAAPASSASGTRSCRPARCRVAEPNMYSASAFAISVLPVPVGPTSSSTPSGRVGSLSPALAIAMRSTTPSTASLWPITRSSKNAAHVARASAAASGRASSAAGPRWPRAWSARRRS